jgi:hypothetical protein
MAPESEIVPIGVNSGQSSPFGGHMRRKLALAALLLALGFSAYEAFTHKAQVQVTDDGTPPPPSFP